MSDTRSPIDPALLRPVLAPTLGPAGRCRPRRTCRRPSSTGRRSTSSRPGGSASAGPTTWRSPATSGPSASGTRACCWSATRRGRLNAFYNTCRHRGHELLEPGAQRNLRAIKCPYHAWVYGLDGSLNGAPRFGDVPGFDKREYPLIAARVAEWHGWVFVNASGDAPALDEYVGNLDELVAPWEPERMFVAATHDYVIDANWKTITENYHECYHCPSIHPALCVVTPVDSGENFPHDGMWVGGSMELKDFAQTMSITRRERGRADPRAERQAGARGLLLRPVPEPADQPASRLRDDAPVRAASAPTETKVECQWLFPPEAKERPGLLARLRQRVLGHHEP